MSLVVIYSMGIVQVERNHTKGGNNMKIDFIFKQLVDKLDATLANTNDSSIYLQENEDLIAGFHLRNPYLNYKLLSEYDLLSLSEKQRNYCNKYCCSPFDNILLVFYKHDNKPAFKIINGMGSRLIMDLHKIWETIEVK